MSADLEAGAVLLAGPVAATEVDVASLLLTASTAGLTLTSTAIEVTGAFGSGAGPVLTRDGSGVG